MAECPIPQNMYPEKNERVRLEGHYRRKNKFLTLFLISCAVLVAGFGVSAIWGNGGTDWLRENHGGLAGKTDTESTAEETDTLEEQSTVGDSDPEGIPSNAVPIVSMDISCSDRGTGYINNECIYVPNVEALLEYYVSSVLSEDPMVLILHTHTSEAYTSDLERYLEGELGSVTYSEDESRNMIAVGESLRDTLGKHGISAIHSRVIHDKDGMRGAYERAEETIRFFLAHYPSIKYVIDLHRDAILTEDGAYVRAITEVDGVPVAQIMSVVGTDGGGEACDDWEGNLALALQLRSALNSEGRTLCRPITLRNATYNQELAPYSLLLEIGTGANTVEEAKRAAVLFGEAFANLILK